MEITGSDRIIFSELSSPNAQNMEVSLRSEEFSQKSLPQKATIAGDPRSAKSFFIEVSPEKAQSDKFSQSAEVFSSKSPQSSIALPHANSAFFENTNLSSHLKSPQFRPKITISVPRSSQPKKP